MFDLCRDVMQASITDFRFHDLRHTFGTDAGVDVVKIKELMM